jgi:hypothetical protein
MIRSAVINRSPYEGLITALAVGGFFIILGSMFVFTPGLVKATNEFFGDLTTVTYSLGSSGTVNLPAPAYPSLNLNFFGAVMNFLLAIGILQIVILVFRLWVRSPTRRIAETIGNLIFWLGAAVMAYVFLLSGTLNGWFQFWATLVILAGASLVARFFVYFAQKYRVQG